MPIPALTTSGILNGASAVQTSMTVPLNELRTAINNVLAGTQPLELASLDDEALTIASGAITITSNYHTVDTEAAAATDDLVTINGSVKGQLLFLTIANSSRSVVIKHNTGNIFCSGAVDITIDSSNIMVIGLYNGTRWMMMDAKTAFSLIPTAEPGPTILSGSTNGRPILVTGTNSGTADTIHTAHASSLDQVFLYAQNTDTTVRTLTLLFGGTTSPDDEIKLDLGPESGVALVIPGFLLTGGVILKAFGSSANVITISGEVRRDALNVIALSGLTNGRSLKIAATATAGTLVHTTHATSKDRVFLYAYNSHTAAVKLTVEFGGTTAPNDLIEATIPKQQGVFIHIPGYPLTGGLVVRAFAGTTNVITVNGYAIREA